MGDISKIQLPSSETIYNIKDEVARNKLDLLKEYSIIKFSGNINRSTYISQFDGAKQYSNKTLFNPISYIFVERNGDTVISIISGNDIASGIDTETTHEVQYYIASWGTISFIQYLTKSQLVCLINKTVSTNDNHQLDLYLIEENISENNLSNQQCVIVKRNDYNDNYDYKISNKLIHHNDFSSIKIFPLYYHPFDNSGKYFRVGTSSEVIEKLNAEVIIYDDDYGHLDGRNPYALDYYVSNPDQVQLLYQQPSSGLQIITPNIFNYWEPESNEYFYGILITWTENTPSEKGNQEEHRTLQNDLYKLKQQILTTLDLTKVSIAAGERSLSDLDWIDNNQEQGMFKLPFESDNSHCYGVACVIKDSETNEVLDIIFHNYENSPDYDFNFTIDEVEYYLPTFFMPKNDFYFEQTQMTPTIWYNIIDNNSGNIVTDLPFNIDLYYMMKDEKGNKSNQNSIFYNFNDLKEIINQYNIDLTSSFPLGNEYGWFKISDKPLYYEDKNSFITLARSINSDSRSMFYDNSDMTSTIISIMNQGLQHTDSNGFDRISITENGVDYYPIFTSDENGFYVYLPVAMNNDLINSYLILTYETKESNNQGVFYVNYYYNYEDNSITCDKTFTEIVEAAESQQMVVPLIEMYGTINQGAIHSGDYHSIEIDVIVTDTSSDFSNFQIYHNSSDDITYHIYNAPGIQYHHMLSETYEDDPFFQKTINSARLVQGYLPIPNANIIIVDKLPTQNIIPVTNTNQDELNLYYAYYNNLKGWVPQALAEAQGITEGWYDGSNFIPLFLQDNNVEYNGIIYNIEDNYKLVDGEKDETVVNLLIDESLHAWIGERWKRLDSNTELVDCVKLPSSWFGGELFRAEEPVLYFGNEIMPFNFIKCDSLPVEDIIPITTDLESFTIYYISRNNIQGYIPSEIASQYGLETGWYTLQQLMTILSQLNDSNAEYIGVVSDYHELMAENTDDNMHNNYGLVIKHSFYVHEISNNYIYLGGPAIQQGEGTNSLILNNDRDTATGLFSLVNGVRNDASGNYSHAEGYRTSAAGEASHSEGSEAGAYGQASHAEGWSWANGDIAHSEGEITYAYGEASHSEGFETKAHGKAQHVSGRYNIEENALDETDYGTYAEIVGNGTSTTRSNARTLDWNGNEVIAGKITVGSQGNNNMDVATVGYVGTQVGGINNYTFSFDNETGTLEINYIT